MAFIDRISKTPKGGGFIMDGYWCWDGSAILGEDGRYHLFSSRWPIEYKMHPGWTYFSEVIRSSSDTPEGPYVFEEVVFSSRGAEHWDGVATHNPMIQKHGDTFLLFYTGITHDDDVQTPEDILAIAEDKERYKRCWETKRIGLATSKSVKGPWKRPDAPILDTRKDAWDQSLVSNAAPCVLPDGSVKMLYKSNGLHESVYGPFYLGIAGADHWSGEFKRLSDEPVISGNIEDPFMWYEDGEFRAIMKDMSGAICGEHHAGISLRSKDGLTWQPDDNPKAYSRNILWDDGEEKTMHCRERPSLLFNEEGKPTHLFNATGWGPEGQGFNHSTHTWTMVACLD